MDGSTSTVRILFPFWGDRHFSPREIGPYAQALEASGVVDYLQTWDQTCSWWPKSLWDKETVPAAALLKDPDSYQDAMVSAAFGVAATKNLGVAVSTDTLRRSPAELLQTMTTLGGATDALFMLGVGEVKAATPFGHRRVEGLGRMRECLHIMRMFQETDGPISYDGEFYKYKDAFLGSAFPPVKITTIGGGPQMMDITARYADGFATCAPWVATSGERSGELRESILAKVAEYGRDPSAFQLGLWHIVMIVKDDEDRDMILDHPLTRWLTAIMGRMHMSDWKAEGIEPPFPLDWHYALKLLPVTMGRDEVDQILARTTREMAEKSFHVGTVEDVAAQIKPHIDAGVSYHSLCDMAPACRPLEEAPWAMEQGLKLAAMLKNG